jgi:hypothetical protein
VDDLSADPLDCSGLGAGDGHDDPGRLPLDPAERDVADVAVDVEPGPRRERVEVEGRSGRRATGEGGETAGQPDGDGDGTCEEGPTADAGRVTTEVNDTRN